MDIRKGKVTEYRRGCIVMTHVEWEDGHEEFEIHECRPQLLYRSLEPGSLAEAQKVMATLAGLDDVPLLPSGQESTG